MISGKLVDGPVSLALLANTTDNDCGEVITSPVNCTCGFKNLPENLPKTGNRGLLGARKVCDK